MPPTEITRSTPPITAVLSALRISTSSACTVTDASTRKPASVSSSVTSGPSESTPPWAVRSSTTTTRARPATGASISIVLTVAPASSKSAAALDNSGSRPSTEISRTRSSRVGRIIGHRPRARR
ncbi:Uncharacterised protein [Mycobacteroides abscessus subsp. abscessus]|nr:Uncharacterised protein [Mycobacteroides abscessus subsp. abscessus]